MWCILASVISVRDLSKHYCVHEKEAGLGGSLYAFKRRYKTVEAVAGVTLEIAAGELVGFLGANGAGKTAGLEMLSGLLHPTSGEVTVAGFVPKRRQEAIFIRPFPTSSTFPSKSLWET